MTKINTDYHDRPAHRGHTVEVQEWSSSYVMLVIRSDDRTCEALVTPRDLELLTMAAEYATR
jgi:hypothetical protein